MSGPSCNHYECRCIEACDGIPIEALTPGTMRGLVETLTVLERSCLLLRDADEERVRAVVASMLFVLAQRLAPFRGQERQS